MCNTMSGCYVHDDMFLDDYYMDEQWAYISGAPGYMVSDKGRVWSERTHRFLKLKPLDDHGHLGVCLATENGPIYRYIHRLVAEAFIPNPKNYPVVRHICDDPMFNSSEDLKWGTQRDNILDAMANGRSYMLSDEDREKSHSKSRTPIKAIDLRTGKSKIFSSQGEAERILGIPQSNINKVLVGQRRSAGNYGFVYIDKEDSNGY